MSSLSPFLKLAAKAFATLPPEDALRTLRTCQIVPEAERNELNQALVEYGESKQAEWEAAVRANNGIAREEAVQEQMRRLSEHQRETVAEMREAERLEQAEASYQNIVAKQRRNLGLPTPPSRP